MKKLFCCLSFALIAISFAFKANPVAYTIYDKNGKEASWADLVSYCKKQDAVFFGELHNNAIGHWLQLKLTQDLYTANNNLVLGAEMFENDQQILLNEYLNKQIAEKNFEAEMRLWTNYKTDYKPLVNFAADKQLKFIATNVPRRYAALVAKKGKDELLNLSADAKKLLCPLPLEADTALPGYSEMMKMDMGHGSSLNMVYAQAIKDATMAHFISKNLPGKGVFLHFNGAYHSNQFAGIVHYLKLYARKTSVATISTVQQKNVGELESENKGIADFIIVVDEEMTSTH